MGNQVFSSFIWVINVIETLQWDKYIWLEIKIGHIFLLLISKYEGLCLVERKQFGKEVRNRETEFWWAEQCMLMKAMLSMC